MQSSLSRTSWPHVFVFPGWCARAAFESLCKQSSRAATRVTRKMRALRTIEPRSPLLVGTWPHRLCQTGRREKIVFLRTPKPDACHDPRTEIIANNSTTNGSNATVWYTAFGGVASASTHRYSRLRDDLWSDRGILKKIVLKSFSRTHVLHESSKK